MNEIIYEVTIEQYWITAEVYAGIVAHRITEDGKYLIKLMRPGFHRQLKEFLQEHKTK